LAWGIVVETKRQAMEKTHGITVKLAERHIERTISRKRQRGRGRGGGIFVGTKLNIKAE
jgi:hypothetical protein